MKVELFYHGHMDGDEPIIVTEQEFLQIWAESLGNESAYFDVYFEDDAHPQMVDLTYIDGWDVTFQVDDETMFFSKDTVSNDDALALVLGMYRQDFAWVKDDFVWSLYENSDVLDDIADIEFDDTFTEFLKDEAQKLDTNNQVGQKNASNKASLADLRQFVAQMNLPSDQAEVFFKAMQGMDLPHPDNMTGEQQIKMVRDVAEQAGLKMRDAKKHESQRFDPNKRSFWDWLKNPFS